MAEILTDDEYGRVESGAWVAVTERGARLSPSSPLHDGQEIILRAANPAQDLQAFGFPINREGEIVGVSEMLQIRAYEEHHPDADVYEMPLVEIREALAAVAVSPPPFFGHLQGEAMARLPAQFQRFNVHISVPAHRLVPL